MEGDRNSLGMDFPNLPYVKIGDKVTTEMFACAWAICENADACALLGTNGV